MTELFFSLLILSVGIVGFFHLSRFLRRLATIRLTWRLSPALYLMVVVTVLVALFSLLPVVYAASNDISGRVIKDVEGNGSISDPLDTPLEDVHVYLFRDTGDDVPNTGDTLVAWTLTDATGAYSFAGLANGTYWVVVESDDINNLGTSVEQTYGGVGALVDPDANSATAATPRTTAGSAFGGRRMLVWDGFTTETQLLDKAEHINRVVLDGTGSGQTNRDFGFGFMKGLAGGYSEYYIPTQMVTTTASTGEAVSGAYGAMAGGIWSILRDLDNDPAIATGMHYIIGVAASTDNTTVYYDHWEDGYDFDPLNSATADETVTLNKGQVQVFESANIPHDPRNPANTFYDGRDRIIVAGGPAVVSVAFYPVSPGSVYNAAVEVLPIKPLQTNYVVPVGEGMTGGNGQYDFSQTFLTIQSASDNNFITVVDPVGGTITRTLNKGQVLDVRHTTPGTVVTGTAPIQVHLLGGYQQTGAYSEMDGVAIFPKTLWDDEYYNPVESAGVAQDGNRYGTEMYLYNPTPNSIQIFWEDTSGSGYYTLPAYASRTYAQMSGHFVPVGSASYVKSMGGEKFWMIGQGGVYASNLTNFNNGIAGGGQSHTNYDSGYSVVPGYLLRSDYYLAWAPGDADGNLATRDSSAVYVTAVNNGTEIFIDFNGDGVADQTDFDNADGDNDQTTGMEYSIVLNRLQSIQIMNPTSPYLMTGAHIWSNGPTAAVWGPYPRDAVVTTPSLDAGYTMLPLPLEWMDAVLGILKSVDSGTFKPAVGQVATFTLSIPAYQAVEDVIATDTLPIGWNFSAGTSNVSVTKNGVTASSTANPTITGNGTTTRERLTWNFVTLLGSGMDDLDPNDYIVIKFTAVTNASVQTGYNQNDTNACGTRTVGSATQTFCAEDKLAVYVVPLSIDKDTTTPYVAAGGVATYTITFQNTDTVNDLTNLRITDTLPAGFSYIAGSAIYTVTDNVPAGDTSPGNGVAPATIPAGGATNLVWGNWTLGNGDRLTVTFRVTVSTLAGTYDNTAIASAVLGGTRFTITDNGPTGNDLGTPLDADPEDDEDVTVGLALSGKAWLDNGVGGGTVYDGIRNGTEPGHANIVVNLLDSTGAYVLQTMLTDANGDYIFRGLAANTTYIVEFGTPPAGHFTTLQDQGLDPTVDSDVHPTTRRVTVPLAGASVANVDAGFVPYSSIGDRVWNDANGNGVQDTGEGGIPGITVTLYLGLTPVQTVTTDASGLYTFTNVVSGTYSVQFTRPATYTFSAVDQGGDDNTDSDANPATGQTATFVVNAGQVITNVDAGMYEPATIGDSVWFDLNQDGIQNEVNGLAGITLTLTYPNGTVITTTTSSTGAYSFTVPSNQAYTLTVIAANFAPGGPLAAYTSTLSNQGGDDALDSDGQPDGSGGVIFVTPVITQNNDTFDFGFYIPVEPALTKAVSFTPGLTATLGTSMTYVITIPDPAISRTLTSVVVTDTLNSALYPVTATVSGGLTPTVALNGQVMTATFGAIAAGSQARITVTAIISNAAIAGGAAITNTAMMTHAQATALTPSNPVTTTIGEPSLTIGKSVASSSGSLTNLDGTALLTYTIRLTNSGTSPAYSVRLTDAVPSGISVTNYLGSFPWSGPVIGPNVMTWTINTIDNLSPNNVVVLTYTAHLSGAVAGGSVTNLVTTTYHSLTDTVPGARPYGPLTTTTTVTLARPNVIKTVAPPSSNASPLQIGDIITYTLVTTVPPGASVPWPYQYDYLPVGFRYVTNTFAITTNLPFNGVSLTDTLSLPLVSEGITGDIGVLGLTSTANPNVGPRFGTPGQQALEWWLQPLNNGGRSTTGLITVTFQVQLIGLDLTGVVTWTDQLNVDNGTNRSFLRWNLQDAGRYTTTVPVDTDTSSQPTTYIAQPSLTLDKHSVPAPGTTVSPGDTITYTLTITNNGRAPAYDLVLTDTLPAGLTYQNTISNPGPGVIITPTRTGQLITYTINQLAAGPGVSMVITLTARVANPITGGVTLINTASLPYYDSQPGSGPGIISPTQRTYSDGSDNVSHPVAIVPGLALDPDHTETVPPGQTITYTHVLTNEGNATDTFTLTVTSVGPFPVTDNIPPSITLAAGQTATFVITVTVPTGASATDQGVTVITATSTLSPSLSAVDTDTTNTAVVPGLSLDPDHTQTVPPGQVVTYTHMLTNEGNATDTFTLTVTSVGPFPTTDDVPPNITLTAGQTATFVITVTVPLTASATDQGVTVITATSTLSPALQVTDTDTTNVELADVTIVKTDDPDPVAAGGILTYTLVYTNDGAAVAQNVVITDTLPAGVTFGGVVSTSPALPAPAGAGQMWVWTVGTLAPGSSGSIVFTVTVDSNTSGVITNSVVITTSTPDSNLGNNNDDEPTEVGKPGLNISKTRISSSPVLIGQPVQFQIVVENIGNTDLTTVTLIDTYDTAYLAYNGANPVSDDNTNDGVLTWANLGPIAVGGRVTVTVNFTATASTQALLNGVTINAARALATDTNGTSVLPVNDTDTVGVINPGLTVDKSINIARVAPHQIVTYTITITNVGDVTINPVRVTDTLDAGLVFIPGTATPAPSAVNGQQLVWNDVMGGAGLAPHARTQITLLVSVPTITGTYGNLVVTTGGHPAGTTPPVTDTVSTHVEDPSIQVDKELNAPGVVGELITFTIRLTNTGPSILDQVPLFDSFTGPVQYVGGTPRADTVDNINRRLAWNDLTAFFGDLAPGQSVAITTIFRLTTTDTEFSMINTARVTNADDVFNNVANEDEDTEVLTNVPTAVDLLYFTSQQAGANVELHWATAVEYDNYGFRLLRSITGNFADAVEIGFVPGQGQGTVSGTTYTFTDKTVDANQTYTYWLVDVDFNGLETPHPETTSISLSAGGNGAKIYLPLIVK
jgi:uncharacterized repeat protein (TIGR01451 family)/fimbrial isopeptide formation D2 family protein